MTTDPYPTRPETDRADSDRRGALGCLGCAGGGGLGLLLLVALVGLAASNLRSCDVEIGPTGPGEGTASQQVGVLVSRTDGLTDGTVVRVASDAFEPRSIVGVVVCLGEAIDQQRGREACDDVGGARYATDGDGTLDATYAVPQRIRVEGRVHDCGSAPGRCVLVAASSDDYDRSGGQRLTFATPGAGVEPPTTRPQTDALAGTLAPPGPLTAGTEVTVMAQGFQPGEPLLLAWCTDRFAEDGPEACEPVDSEAALTAVLMRSIPDEAPVADADGSARVTIEARARIEPAFDTTDRSVDCALAPGRCAVVVAAAADTRRSAVVPYELTR